MPLRVENLQWQIEVRREPKIATLYKLVLKVIPHVIKNQLTLYTEAIERKKSERSSALPYPCERNAE